MRDKPRCLLQSSKVNLLGTDSVRFIAMFVLTKSGGNSYKLFCFWFKMILFGSKFLFMFFSIYCISSRLPLRLVLLIYCRILLKEHEIILEVKVTCRRHEVQLKETLFLGASGQWPGQEWPLPYDTSFYYSSLMTFYEGDIFPSNGLLIFIAEMWLL